MMVSLTAQNTNLMFSVSVKMEKHEIRMSLITGGAGEVGIDNLLGVWIQIYEHSKNEFPSSYCILLRTCGEN